MKNRTIVYSDECVEFIDSLDQRAAEKLSYIVSIIATADMVSTKFIKKLTNTLFYELRISVANEIRIIIFALDDLNINNATQIVFLNGFIKKSTKDYSEYIKRAENILKK
ncbi:MAG: type II toxin-antitoxin system RelE/ParE family toxin [Mucinivorans sp.]